MGNHPLMDWGVFPHRDEDKGDYQVASWTIEQLRKVAAEKPVFLAAGFFLVAPLLGVGLYEISRNLERGEEVQFCQALEGWNSNRV